MARILVIDDEPGILDVLYTVFHHKGHDVLLAERGGKGLELFQQERPDVTILDFMMPDMKGLDVLREIRTLDPQAPVIILTGFATPGRQQQARELGVTEFLQKGLALHTLGAAVDRVLAQSGIVIEEQRRQFPRFLIQFPIVLFQDGIRIGDGTGYDLSAGGCTVASQMILKEGDHVTLQLCLPENENPTTPMMVEIAAVVRWAIKPKLGLEFISLPSGDQLRIRRYVKTCLTTSPYNS
jgi:CheY-like chemotaxis protein